VQRKGAVSFLCAGASDCGSFAVVIGVAAREVGPWNLGMGFLSVLLFFAPPEE